MAELRCRHCKHPVDVSSTACPRCGAPIQCEPIMEDLCIDIGESRPERLAWLKYLLLFVFLGEVIFFIVYALME